MSEAVNAAKDAPVISKTLAPITMFVVSLYQMPAITRRPPLTATILGMKSLFAIGEFTKIGNAHSVLSEVKDDLDNAEFRTRAEKELESRIHTAETCLE